MGNLDSSGSRYHLISKFNIHLSHACRNTVHNISGGEEIRTPDPLLAKQVLYQLSYAPVSNPNRPWFATTGEARVPLGSRHLLSVMRVHGFEPWTSALSELRSSQLSYTRALLSLYCETFSTLTPKHPHQMQEPNRLVWLSSVNLIGIRESYPFVMKETMAWWLW